MSFGGSTKTSEASHAATNVGISTEIRGRFRLANQYLLTTDLPFAASVHLPSAGPSEAAFRVASPQLGFAYVVSPRARAWLTVGIGVTLPVTSKPHGTAEVKAAVNLALGLGQAMRGSWDRWKYLPEALTFAVPVEFELGTDRVRWGAESTLATVAHVGDGDGHGLHIWQLGTRIQTYVTSALSLGARVRAVFILDDGTDDHSQVSAEPFIDLTAGHFMFGLGVIVNLDKPNGPSSDDLFVWGTRFALGGVF